MSVEPDGRGRPAYGNVDRCDVTVRRPGAEIDAELLFADTGAGAPPDAPTEDHGGITVVRTPRRGNACGRVLRLTGGTEVDVVVELDDGDSPDLCPMADSVTGTALAVLARGPVPRRPVPFPAASLGRVDACSLLDATALAAVPGLRAAVPDRSFGGWGCDWNGPSNDADVTVTFDRNNGGMVRDDGPRTRVGDRDAAELADGRRGCAVTVVHRPFTDTDGDPSAELVEIDVRFDAPVPGPCATAGAVAAAAVRRLPAPA